MSEVCPALEELEPAIQSRSVEQRAQRLARGEAENAGRRPQTDAVNDAGNGQFLGVDGAGELPRLAHHEIWAPVLREQVVEERLRQLRKNPHRTW
jgi:hypothetical protein